MIKIIKRICIIIIVLLALISIKVYANELSFECQESVDIKKQDTIEVTLKGNFTDDVNSIKIRYTIPGGVSFQGFTPNKNWNLEQGGTSATTGMVLRISNGDVNGEVEFGKFIFKIPSGYDKKSIKFNFYDFDATNTSCEIIEFSKDSVEKNVSLVEKDSNNNESEEQNETKDNEENKDNKEGEQSSQKDDTKKDDTQKDDVKKDDTQKDNTKKDNTQKDNTEKTNTNNNKSNSEKNEKDNTLANKKFGQYGGKVYIGIAIIIIIAIVLIFRFKLKKLKYIK